MFLEDIDDWFWQINKSEMANQLFEIRTACTQICRNNGNIYLTIWLVLIWPRSHWNSASIFIFCRATSMFRDSGWRFYVPQGSCSRNSKVLDVYCIYDVWRLQCLKIPYCFEKRWSSPERSWRVCKMVDWTRYILHSKELLCVEALSSEIFAFKNFSHSRIFERE